MNRWRNPVDMLNYRLTSNTYIFSDVLLRDGCGCKFTKLAFIITGHDLFAPHALALEHSDVRHACNR